MAGFTLAALALGLSAAGTATQAIGAHKAGQAGEKAGKAAADISESQADVADFNAHVADLQSQDALDRGGEQANEFRLKVRGAIGAQRTGFAAGNIDVGYGSAVDVQADAAFLGKLDEATIRTNAAREAWGYQVQAYDYRKAAEIDRKAAKNQIAAGEQAASAGNWNAASAIVGGTASLLEARYGFSGKGK
jgi:hypothetical protein